jgi:hypothetical protein
MILNEIDVTPVEFAFVDDRLLIAQCGDEIVGRSYPSDVPPRVEQVLNDLVNVVDCQGPFSQTAPATVTITDEKGRQIRNLKWSCRRLDISMNFFDQGYWIEIKVGNLVQRRPLVWAIYKQRIIDEDETFH